MPAPPTARAALPTTIRALLDGAAPVARADAEVLLCHVLGRARAFLYAYPDHRLDGGELQRMADILVRRARGEPLAYLTGRREFWSLELEVSHATLVPRPETELLVECVLALRANAELDVLDLGTGSGAIALALASERARWRVLGVDIDADAVAVAERNAARLGVAAHFAIGDWYGSLARARFDLIVANPPYIREDDACLDDDGLLFEPRRALAAGADGLEALRRVIDGARAHLRRDGLLACEHGAVQGADVRALFERAGFRAVTTLHDLAGHERVTHGHSVGEPGDE